MRAIVVGGGVGGLATALGLGRRGVDCVVLEQAAELRFAGFGLTVQPNAVAALETLGAAEALRSVGRPLTSMRIETASGRTLSVMRTPAADAPLGVERAALLGVLADALRRDAPEVRVRTGARVEAIHEGPDRVTARLVGGDAVEGDVLIGADGLHSVVRAALFGASPPRYAGYTCWRGLARGPRLDTSSARELWGRGKRFGLVPLGDGLIYWFAAANTPPGVSDGPDPIRELRARFSGWSQAVRGVLEAATQAEMARHDCYDRPPSADWGRGRITLVGDAAHAMTPNMGQGACQTLEDAAVLSALVARPGGDPVGALRAYEDARRRRAASFVSRSWSFGRLGQRENAVVCALRNAAAWVVPSALTTRMMRKVWRFELPVDPTPTEASISEAPPG